VAVRSEEKVYLDYRLLSMDYVFGCDTNQGSRSPELLLSDTACFFPSCAILDKFDG